MDLSNLMIPGILVVGLVLFLPKIVGRRGNTDRRHDPRTQPYGNYPPYPSYAPPPPVAPFVMNIVWLIVFLVIGAAVLEIRAPGVLHMLLRLCGLS